MADRPQPLVVRETGGQAAWPLATPVVVIQDTERDDLREKRAGLDAEAKIIAKRLAIV
jgi:hypothetical protein